MCSTWLLIPAQFPNPQIKHPTLICQIIKENTPPTIRKPNKHPQKQLLLLLSPPPYPLLIRSITFPLTNMNLPRTRITTTTKKSILLFSPLVTMCFLLSYTDWITTGCSCSALCVWMLPSVGLVLMVTLVIVAARATMVTWVTVLVLLAFAGKRRRVLVQHGRKITADVAMHLFRILLKERGLFAVVCATIVSLMALVRLREAE